MQVRRYGRTAARQARTCQSGLRRLITQHAAVPLPPVLHCISPFSSTQLLLLQSGSCHKGLRTHTQIVVVLAQASRATVDSSASLPLTLSGVLSSPKTLETPSSLTIHTHRNQQTDMVMQCFAGWLVGCIAFACPASSPVPPAPQLHLTCTSTKRHDRSAVTQL